VGKGDFLERIVKFEQVVANTLGKFQLSTDELVKSLRGAEMMGFITDKETGQVSAAKLKEFLSLTERMTQMTHGIVNPATILGLAQQGGPALMQLNDEGLMTLLMVSQMMGGGRAGTAMMSLYQQLGGGVMYGRTAEELEKLGLLKPEEWKFEHGKVVVTPEASMRMTKQMGKDPMEWAKNVVLPAMAAKGITTPEEINVELFKMLQRQTTERMVADIIRNMKQMESEKGRIRSAAGVEEGLALEQADIPQAQTNISAALHNLNLALVGDGKNIAHGLNQLADVINAISGGFMAFDKWTIESGKKIQEAFAGFDQWTIESGKHIQAFGKALIDGLKSAVEAAIAGIPAVFAGIGSAILDAIRAIVPGLAPSPAPTSAPPVNPLKGGSNTLPSPSTTPSPSVSPLAPEPGPFTQAEPTKKQAYNAVPPAGSGTGGSPAQAGDVYLDGQKITEIIAGRLADLSSGPEEGSSYYDNTRGAPAQSSSMAFG